MGKPVNILYMIDSLHYGGTELQLVQLIRHIDRSRFQPHICILKPSNSLYDELDIPKLFLNFKGFNCVSLPRNILDLSRFIRTHRIQFIQTFFQDPFLLAAVVKPFHRVKLIGSFRDLGFWRNWKSTLKMRMAYPFFSGFIANSQAVKEHFVHADGIFEERIEVIYNGINTENHLRTQWINKDGKSPVVGIVANLNRPVKRVEDFVYAAALVLKKMPQVKFIVVGDGYLRSELEQLSFNLGINESLSFVGRISNPFYVIATFDIGVITSYTEGFCNAILEYMLCGVSVIATKVAGNLEIIEDGLNGCLYQVGDTEELACKIAGLLKNDRKYIIENNKRKVRECFSLTSMLLSYEQYYYKLSNYI